jgi:hypothetical protein
MSLRSRISALVLSFRTAISHKSGLLSRKLLYLLLWRALLVMTCGEAQSVQLSAASTVAAIAVSLLMSICGLNGFGIISRLGAPLSRHSDRSGAELAFPEISRTWQCGNCSLNLTAKAMPSIFGIMTSLTTM